MAEDSGDLTPDIKSELKHLREVLGVQLERIEEKLDELKNSDRGLWAAHRGLREELLEAVANRGLVTEQRELERRIAQIETDKAVAAGQLKLIVALASLVGAAAAAAMRALVS
jgi:hypothetical protein